MSEQPKRKRIRYRKVAHGLYTVIYDGKELSFGNSTEAKKMYRALVKKSKAA